MKVKVLDLLIYSICGGLFFEIPSIRKFFPLARETFLVCMVISVSIIVYYMVNRRIKLEKTGVFLLIFVGYFFVNTILHNGNMLAFGSEFLPVLVVCISFSLRPNWADDGAIGKWIFFLTSVTLIDLITQILFPDGMYESAQYTQNWFLGYKTNRMLYSFPLLAFLNVRASRKTKFTIQYILLCGMTLVNMYLSDGTGGLAIMMLYEAAAVLILFRKYHGKKMLVFMQFLFKYQIIFGIVAAFFALLIGANSSTILRMITFFFVEKSITLSGRTRIWANAIAWNRRSIWRGFGYLDGSQFYDHLGFYNPHNMILSYSLSGGVIGIVLLMLFVFSALRKMRETDENLILLLAIYSVVALGMISSILSFSPFFFALFFIIANNKKQNQGKEK